MKLCTPKQMQNIDRRAIDDMGIPGLELMENAGSAVVEAITEQFGEVEGEAITVVCGKGNNGGDGFVIARLLNEMKALIGGAAIQLTFGHPSIYFTHFKRILVYPDSYYS